MLYVYEVKPYDYVMYVISTIRPDRYIRRVGGRGDGGGGAGGGGGGGGNKWHTQ
jgi:hypothetical protein